MQLEALTGSIGAEIHGLDLTEATPEAAAVISAAVVQHKVVVFRRQQAMDPARQRRLSGLLGNVFVHPFSRPLDGERDVYVLETDGGYVGSRDYWHTDVSWAPCPPSFTILRAVEVPDHGRDTIWVDMEAVVADFSSPFVEMLCGLDAVHDWRHVPSFARHAGAEHAPPPVTHPVIRTHPSTGRRSLFVNQMFTTSIDGLRPDESGALLEHLFSQTRYPDFQVRVRWEHGMVVIWDNRSTQHSIIHDRLARRVMHRVTLAGERPVRACSGESISTESSFARDSYV